MSRKMSTKNGGQIWDIYVDTMVDIKVDRVGINTLTEKCEESCEKYREVQRENDSESPQEYQSAA